MTKQIRGNITHCFKKLTGKWHKVKMDESQDPVPNDCLLFFTDNKGRVNRVDAISKLDFDALLEVYAVYEKEGKIMAKQLKGEEENVQ